MHVNAWSMTGHGWLVSGTLLVRQWSVSKRFLSACSVCGQLMVSGCSMYGIEWSVCISGWSISGHPGGGLHSLSAHVLISIIRLELVRLGE